MDLQRPFSQACENNKHPILRILKSAFAPCHHVLEIGSGTGQHACYFAEQLRHLKWQPSDLAHAHPGIQMWLDDYSGQNILPLLELDIENPVWPEGFDAVFSANTAHIMPWSLVQRMLAEVAQRLPINGVFALYGPFNYDGKFSSESNAEFDVWLKSRASYSGIRDVEKVNGIVRDNGMHLVRDHTMPANNRLLLWKKLPKPELA